MHNCLCAQISPLIRTRSHWIRARPNDPILTWLPLLRACFLTRSQSEALALGLQRVFLAGHDLALITGNSSRRAILFFVFRPAPSSRPSPRDFPGVVSLAGLPGGSVTRGAASSDFRSGHMSRQRHVREESLPAEPACEKTASCRENWTGFGVRA